MQSLAQSIRQLEQRLAQIEETTLEEAIGSSLAGMVSNTGVQTSHSVQELVKALTPLTPAGISAVIALLIAHKAELPQDVQGAIGQLAGAAGQQVPAPTGQERMRPIPGPQGSQQPVQSQNLAAR